MFVYHRKPASLEGETLFPLNVIKSKYPAIYDAQSSKYKGREELMQRKIPLLNCLWNDVLHLAPVHPNHVIENLKIAGGKPGVSTWYRFSAEVLRGLDVVFYKGPVDRSPILDTPHFSRFEIDQYIELTDLPELTKKYYHDSFVNNRKPLMFVGCPHVLLKGSIDINQGEEISVG